MSENKVSENSVLTRNQSQARREMFERIRTALGKSTTRKPEESVPVIDPALVRTVNTGVDLTNLFIQRAMEVGAKVRTIRGDELNKTVIECLTITGVKKVALAVGTVAQALGLPDALRRKGFELVDWRTGKSLAGLFDLEAGITDVHAAVAETGTLICSADAGHSRGLSLCPRLHIALVRQSDLVGDLTELWPLLIQRGSLPASVVLITGPSKTADIEGVLITGVHGPEQLQIILVQDA